MMVPPRTDTHKSLLTGRNLPTMIIPKFPIYIFASKTVNFITLPTT